MIFLVLSANSCVEKPENLFLEKSGYFIFIRFQVQTAFKTNRISKRSLKSVIMLISRRPLQLDTFFKVSEGSEFPLRNFDIS